MIRKYNNTIDTFIDFYRIDNKNINKNINMRSVTLQVTDDCTCACTYCYQTNKKHNLMLKETAKNIIDLLFKMYDENKEDAFINHDTIGIVLDFIGGEPLMNISTINYACEYFINKCIELDHPWLYRSRFSICSNGDLFFNEEVQNWLKRFRNFISINITIDGPKATHDSCRLHHDGTGNFENAYKAFNWLKDNGYYQSTKVTISPENLLNINETIKFFIENGIQDINGNPIYEHKWTNEEANIYYNELIKMADYLLTLDESTYISFFEQSMFHPKEEHDLECWCGGQGKMLAFDPNGIAYPCLRYMPSSLGDSIEPIIVGNDKFVYESEKDNEIYKKLLAVNRRTKSTDECFYCPIAEGCSDCAAWNYQSSGNLNCKSMNICAMHKARSLANVYYWNNYYIKNNLSQKFKMYLPKEEALKIISEEEYNKLLKLINRKK